MKYRITLKINGKQLDSAHAKNTVAAIGVIKTILKHGLSVYDVKNIKRVNIAIAKLKGK